MKKKHAILTAIGAAALFLALSVPAQPETPNIEQSEPTPHYRRVCSDEKPGHVRCHSEILTDIRSNYSSAAGPLGYGPYELLGAYGLTGTTSSITTIAIVIAFDHPNIFNDLNHYSAVFGIPGLSDCPVSSGTLETPCFQKVDQNGGTDYPIVDASFAVETSMDVEIAHAICQNCNILLVEATDSTYPDMLAAVDRARLMGADIISNSWGSAEFPSELTYDSHFNYPGIAFTFSTGDWGYRNQYPAASPYVTAVGGTTLAVNDLGENVYTRRSEVVWSGAGSGCSAYEPQPAFQVALGLSGCSNRIASDISAVADPATGAAVYDSVIYQRQKGWLRIGGTSLSAPIIAGVYGLAGGVADDVYANEILYSQITPENIFDVISGQNGSCSPSYLCHGVACYDGPSGLGTPNGITAF